MNLNQGTQVSINCPIKIYQGKYYVDIYSSFTMGIHFHMKHFYYQDPFTTIEVAQDKLKNYFSSLGIGYSYKTTIYSLV